MNSLKIRSGVSSATFSISMPPSGLTMSTSRSVARSRTMPEVELALDLEALLDEHALHLLPAGPVWWVTSCMPRIFSAAACASSGALDDLDAAALAAAAGVDLRLDDDGAAAEPLGDGRRASAALTMTSPCGTGTPYFARIAFA